MIRLTPFCYAGETPIYREISNGQERIFWTSACDIDGDGANGKTGIMGAPAGVACYRPDNTGLDYTENAKNPSGDTMEDKWPGVVVVDGQLAIQPPSGYDPGAFISKTAYQFEDKAVNDPDRYLDAAFYNFTCVPPQIRRLAIRGVLGCAARITNLVTKLSAECIVGDIEPKSKAGEISPAAAAKIGLRTSPKWGGTEEKIILFEIFPGKISCYGFPIIPLSK